MIRRIANKILGKTGYIIQRKKKSDPSLQSLQEILGFAIDSDKYAFLYDNLDFLSALKDQGAVYLFKKNLLSVQVDQLYFQINNWEELFILNEIFSEGVYNVSLAENFALIDIGMNVGMASLYFAAKKNCEIIFAYEPFAKTIELAKLNFQLNECAEKIKIHSIGLGYPERTVSVPYSEQSRGSAGILGQTDLSASEERKHLEEMHIKEVSEYFSQNLEKYKGTFIAKIDCEGAEYEIIDRLDKTGLLNKVKIYMIEWHVKGPAFLQSVFVRNGYSVFCKPGKDGTGIMYAVSGN